MGRSARLVLVVVAVGLLGAVVVELGDVHAHAPQGRLRLLVVHLVLVILIIIVLVIVLVIIIIVVLIIVVLHPGTPPGSEANLGWTRQHSCAGRVITCSQQVVHCKRTLPMGAALPHGQAVISPHIRPQQGQAGGPAACWTEEGRASPARIRPMRFMRW